MEAVFNPSNLGTLRTTKSVIVYVSLGRLRLGRSFSSASVCNSSAVSNIFQQALLTCFKAISMDVGIENWGRRRPSSAGAQTYSQLDTWFPSTYSVFLLVWFWQKDIIQACLNWWVPLLHHLLALAPSCLDHLPRPRQNRWSGSQRMDVCSEHLGWHKNHKIERTCLSIWDLHAVTIVWSMCVSPS